MRPTNSVDDRILVLTRVIEAPRARVFKAWTTPGQVAQWWGPEGFITEQCEMDIRPGGAYRVSMRSPDGEVYRKRGVYQEIVAPERIAFTFAWEDGDGKAGHQTVVTVTFEDLGQRTRLTLRQELFETTEWCLDHQRGWTSCLARFAAWLNG